MKVSILIDTLGGIKFTEFVVAATNRERLLHEKQVEKAFKMFDEDGNGFIDLKELKTAMSGLKLTDDEWKDLINQYDSDNDGVVRITQESFFLKKPQN